MEEKSMPGIPRNVPFLLAEAISAVTDSPGDRYKSPESLPMLNLQKKLFGSDGYLTGIFPCLEPLTGHAG